MEEYHCHRVLKCSDRAEAVTRRRRLKDFYQGVFEVDHQYNYKCMFSLRILIHICILIYIYIYIIYMCKCVCNYTHNYKYSIVEVDHKYRIQIPRGAVEPMSFTFKEQGMERDKWGQH